jgi:hypothetical protein
LPIGSVSIQLQFGVGFRGAATSTQNNRSISLWRATAASAKGPRQHNPNTICKLQGVSQVEPLDTAASNLDQVELGPVGRRGAAAALESLEEIEERAHARLIQAIEGGNQFQIKAVQEFYLRSSETLRRLDLAVETERRKADEQLPLRQVQDVARQISTWFTGSFTQFLSVESPALMGISDLGEFKFAAIESFRGILHREVKTALRTNPTIPIWAADRVREGWNV